MRKAQLQLQELSLEIDDDLLFNELNQVQLQNNDDNVDQSEETDDEYFDCFKYSVIVSVHSPKNHVQSSQPLKSESLAINPKCILKDPRTTLMLKNIPLQYQVKDLIVEIDSFIKGQYNFLYMPFDLSKNCNTGYAFINLKNTKFVDSFYKIFDQRRWILCPHKTCTLRYAKNQVNQSE